MIEIVKEKCIGCGKCVNDCFPENIILVDGKAEIKGKCMECGHCFAVCPMNAVHMSGYELTEVIEFNENKSEVDSSALLEIIKSRRSIRNYKKLSVPPEKIELILEGGRFSPTGGNMQDVQYIVIQDNLDIVKEMVWEGLNKILNEPLESDVILNKYRNRLQYLWKQYQSDPQKDRLFFDAPVLLIIRSASHLNGGLAAANIELMAHAQGLGALYSGFIQTILNYNPEICDYLDIKANEICACMLMGYPNIRFYRSVPRKTIQIKWM